MSRFVFLLTLLLATAVLAAPRETGDLGIVIEREAGRVMLVNTAARTHVLEYEGLGDLSHASVVFSRDTRYAYVFGRDGGLTKLDLLEGRVAGRILQAGNSIGGAISQDGRYVAAANYDPGGVRIFDADTLALVADIPAVYGEGPEQRLSKTVGLVDAPGRRFVVSLYDAGEIWIIDLADAGEPSIRKFNDVGFQPYDALITPDGRYYIAGLYGENGLAVLDLWHPDQGVRRMLTSYGRGERELPVYKMPHLEGWAVAGKHLFIPAIGHPAVHVIDTTSWQETARIATRGQPVFAIARPDGRQVWVNYAMPDNSHIEVIDVARMQIVQALEPGKAVLHMEFTDGGEEVWVSVRDEDRVDVYDTETFRKITGIPADKPSGIFFTSRAHKIGL